MDEGQREPQATTKQQAIRPRRTDATGQVVISVNFGGQAHRVREGLGRHRRPVQGQAAGGDRYPDLGRPSRGAERAVQPGRQDRI
jgi:hypothetical protein